MTGAVCDHRHRHLAFREFTGGRHLGMWCPTCRRFVPDDAGRMWMTQKGDLSHVPVIKQEDENA